MTASHAPAPTGRTFMTKSPARSLPSWKPVARRGSSPGAPRRQGSPLFAYGAAGIAGNFLAGIIASRQIGATLIVIAVALAATIFGFAIVGGSPATGAIVLILWGLAYGGGSVALRTWMMKAAPSAIEITTSLFVSIFNVGIALGSFVGGRAVDRFDLHTNLLLSAVLPTLGLLFALAIQSHDADKKSAATAAEL